MKKIQIHITEKNKSKQLTLLNFRDELVNFMYKKTIADSSRTSMRFFVLIFFLSLKIGQDSLLMRLFDENIDKLKNLNKAFSGKTKLKKGEYSNLIKKNGLEYIFKYDTFFILITAILDSRKIITKFDDYFSDNIEIKDEFIKIVNKYEGELEIFDIDFKTHLIADERIDEFGESHDLSKSIYRTIKMRTSRSLDLELHKYAELKIVKSESPIILTIIQYIDPEIVIDLWDTYKLGDYVKVVWGPLSDLAIGFLGSILADKWLKWKSIDGKNNRKEKLKAKAEFDVVKTSHEQNQKLIQLAEVLAGSVVRSNDFLQNEIKVLRDRGEMMLKDKVLVGKEKKIKELQDKIERLENIKVDASEIESN